MTAYMTDYKFNSMGRIGMDQTDSTQKNLQNTRFASYMLSAFFSDATSDSHISFSTEQPIMISNGVANGNGLIGSAVETDTEIMYNKKTDRELHKLQLNPRPFITVPYLGRGSCDPTLELQMKQGDLMTEKKSVGTIMNKSFMAYTMYPLDKDMEDHVTNSVEEIAMDGWVRGGAMSREMSYGKNAKQ